MGGGEEVSLLELRLKFIVQEGELGGSEGGDVEGLHCRAYISNLEGKSRQCAYMTVCMN